MLDLMLKYMQDGGYVMWPILFVSVVVWYIGLIKFKQIVLFKKQSLLFFEQVNEALSSDGALNYSGVSTFEMLAEELNNVRTLKPDSFFEIYRQFLMAVVPYLEKGLSAMSAWISTAPLLGLLGTVTGMIETFKIITVFGVGNPSLTAEGISIALLTTQAGLTVAFPALLFHNYLRNAKESTVARLMKNGEQVLSRLQELSRPKQELK